MRLIVKVLDHARRGDVLEVGLRRCARLWAERYLRRQPDNLWTDLHAFIRGSDSTGCGVSDYWQLHRAIRRYQPREVLECGTGVSTLVIAHALELNGQGRVTSMEEHAGYLDNARSLLPARYRPRVNYVLSDTEECSFGSVVGTRYRDVPARAYTFVFIDGPKTKTADLDFLTVLRRTRHPVRGMIDKRVKTCRALAGLLPGKVRYSRVLGLGFIAPSTAQDLQRSELTVQHNVDTLVG